MTAAEKLTELGRKRGREEGPKEGAGGAHGSSARASVRFGELPRDAIARIHAASDAELALWAERVLGAPSLDEVLRAR